MESDEPASLDNSYSNFPGIESADMGQRDDMDMGASPGPMGDEDGGSRTKAGLRGSGASNESDGFEDQGADNLFASLDKQDESNGFSNVPTSAPQTARGGVESPQAFSMGNTDQDWGSKDWPPRVGKPEHQDQWEANTLDQLARAKMLIAKASVHHSENDRSIHSGGRRNKDKTGAVYTMIKKKMSVTNDLIKALEDRHESVEDTIRQVGECLFQLQRAHRSKWAPLNVCERRLELRDTRPLQELVRDHAQEALEHERQTLIESRQELSDQINSSKEALFSLDKLKTEVVEDLSLKRHGLRIDRSCLSPQAKPQMAGQQERVVLPQLGEIANYNAPPSPKDSERGGASQRDETRQVDTKVLLFKAVGIQEDAMKLCNESDAVMLQTKRECQRATQQVQASLVKRAGETDTLKRQLEAQMREIDDAVAQTEMSLVKTQKKLASQEAPRKALDKQFQALGKQSSSGDDPVRDELLAHLESMKKTTSTLTRKYQNTKTLLESLKESRIHLTEDYRCKLYALKIEDACVKVTARKAMELDRMDPRGGRCKVASARRTPRMEGVYSLDKSMPMPGMQPQAPLASNDF